MKNILITTTSLLLIAAFSCKPTDLSTNEFQHPRDDRNDKTEELPEVKLNKTIFVCGVNAAKSEIILFKNNTRQLLLKCGEDTKISADPDTHYLFEDKLFTTYIDKSNTYIKLNGKDFYVFEGREYIKDMLYLNEELWILSIPIDKSGFILRQNESVLFTSIDGTPDYLYKDQDNVYCKYHTTITGKKHWFLLKNGNPSKLITNTGTIFLDQKIINNRTTSLYVKNNKAFFSDGKKEYSYDLPAGFTLIGGDILPAPKNRYVTLIHLQSNYSPMQADLICREKDNYLAGTGMGIYYYTSEEPGRRVCLSKNLEHLSISNLSDNHIDIAGAYFLGRRCATQCEGKLYVCVSPKDVRNAPYIWIEGEEMKMDFKGELTGISVILPK